MFFVKKGRKLWAILSLVIMMLSFTPIQLMASTDGGTPVSQEVLTDVTNPNQPILTTTQTSTETTIRPTTNNTLTTNTSSTTSNTSTVSKANNATSTNTTVIMNSEVLENDFGSSVSVIPQEKAAILAQVSMPQDSASESDNSLDFSDTIIESEPNLSPMEQPLAEQPESSMKALSPLNLLDTLESATGEPNVTGQVLNEDNTPAGSVDVEFIPLNGSPSFNIVTDATGAFSASIALGEFLVRARASESSSFTNSISEYINVTEGAIYPLNLILTSPKVQGTVYDSNQLPVSGVEVRILSPNSTEAPLDYTTTDMNGYYKLGGVNSGNYTLEFIYQGLIQQVIPNVSLPSSAPLDVSLSLNFVSDQVNGQVLDPNGNSASQVRIEVTRLIDPNTSQSQQVATSDELGRFSFNQPDGEFYVSAVPSPSSPFTRSIPIKVVITNGQMNPYQDLILQLTVPQVEGQVIDESGNPMGNALVSMNYGRPREQRFEDVYFYDSHTWTDESGYFKLGGMVDGEYRIYASDPDLGRTYSPIYVSLQAGQYNGPTLFTIHPYNLTGKVLNPDGSPAPNTRVYVEFPNGGVRLGTTTDSQGNYKGAIEEGDFAIQARSGADTPFTNSYREPIHIIKEQMNTKDLWLTEPKLSGTVYGPDGKPSPNARLVLIPEGGSSPIDSTDTNLSGKYQMGAFGAGNYLLSVSCEGRVNEVPLYIGENQSPQTFDIHFEQANVMGRIVAPDGNTPISQGVIEISSLNGDLNGWDRQRDAGRADDWGNFALYLPDGTYYISAYQNPPSPFTRSVPQQIAIEGGVVTSSIPLTLKLTTPQVMGQVVDTQGNPVGNIEVRMDYASTPTQDWRNGFYFSTWARTDNAGYFQLGGMGDGTYTLLANGFELGEARFSVSIIEGQYMGPAYLKLESNISGIVQEPNSTSGLQANLDFWQAQGTHFKKVLSERTNPDGSFRSFLADGEFYVTATPIGQIPFARSFSQKVTVTNGVADVSFLQIKVTDPLYIGHILDINNYPVANADVSLTFNGNDVFDGQVDDLFLRTDSYGQFSLGGIQDGDYTLKIWNNDGMVSLRLAIVNGQVQAPTELRLFPYNIMGHVQTPDGNPVGQVSVRIRNLYNGYDSFSVRTDDQGNFRAGVSGGEYTVQASVGLNPNLSAWSNSLPQWFQVSDGTNLSISLTLDLTYPKVIGEVRDTEGNLVPLATVTINPDYSTGNPLPWWMTDSVPTDSQGQYKLGGIPSGEYMMRVWKDSINSEDYKVYIPADTMPPQPPQTVNLIISMLPPSPDPLSIITSALPDGTLGQAYTDYGGNKVQLQAAGGTLPYFWQAQNLPEGLTLSKDGILSGTPSVVGDFFPEFTVTDSANPSRSLSAIIGLRVLSPVPELYTIIPQIEMGVNPQDNNNVGIFVGIKEILDEQGRVVTEPKLAGYRVEVIYDPAMMDISHVAPVANWGMFTPNIDPGSGTLYIGDADVEARSDINQLFFLPLNLKGAATDYSPLTLRFIELSDADLNPISTPQDQTLIFQRGKVVNLFTETNPEPHLTDAIGGLQYLANRRQVGFGDKEVNLVNFASIWTPLTSNAVEADLKDIIALMQYLNQMRDNYFN